MAYFKKNLRPNSPEFFFMTFHDFTTRASCSSVKPLSNVEVMLSSSMLNAKMFLFQDCDSSESG